MPLSRHFYSLDEVEAALAYSTGRYDVKETLFWCKELLLSGSTAEAIRTLFETWLWQKGPFMLSWVLSAWKHLSTEEVTEEDLLLHAYQLQSCYRIKDHTLWNLLVSSRLSNGQPDRVTRKTPTYLPPGATETEHFFLRAIHQRKARTAWWVARHLPVERVWEVMKGYAIHGDLYGENRETWITICEHYDQLLGYRSDAYDETMRCAFLLSLCVSSSQRKDSMRDLPSTLSPEGTEALQSFEKTVGRKAHRRYSILPIYLYGSTERGRMRWSEHTRWQLYQIEPYLVGCAFWDSVLEEYSSGVDEAGGIQWKSYDAKEAFYDLYFPDLPPDEWTEKEIAVSHGAGILGPKDQLSLARYAQVHFSKITRLAWNLAPEVYKKLANTVLSVPLTECGPSTYHEALPCPPPVEVDSIKIKPVSRRFRYE
jgi:hypothetical protein